MAKVSPTMTLPSTTLAAMTIAAPVPRSMTSALRKIGASLRVAGVAGLLVLASAFVAACSADENRAVLHTESGEHAFTVELATTPSARSEGLMFRQELADNAGMLFDFKEEREVSFWMRNTYIPLDMLFIAADGEVMKIHANARPHDPTSIPSNHPVRFVLEIPGGRAEEIGARAGDTLEHPLIGE